MSEALWGVIIGGLIVIFGNIVNAFFQKNQNSKNIDARREEQLRQFEFEKQQKEKQLKYEKDQIILGRLIEERKKWIEPLRKSLTNYSLNLKLVHEKLVWIRISYFDYGSENSSKEITQIEKDQLRQNIENWDKTYSELTNTISQISDDKLNEIIEELISAEVSISIIQYIDMDKEKYKHYEERADCATKNIAQAFRRIEELLSGKE
jgi:hypothetical protein